MNAYVFPPIVAGIVALSMSVVRLLSVILTVVPETPPSVEVFPLYVLAGRFLTFVLAYGLLFGVAYWAGTRHTDSSGDVTLPLATGAVAALCYLVGTLAIRRTIDVGYDRWLLDAMAIIGPTGSVGVQLAVVTFAGVALARRRSA